MKIYKKLDNEIVQLCWQFALAVLPMSWTLGKSFFDIGNSRIGSKLLLAFDVTRLPAGSPAEGW